MYTLTTGRGRGITAIPSLLVAVVTGWFTVRVTRQYTRNHRQHTFFWTIALAFSCLASLAYCTTMWTTPHSVWMFEVYYLLGAMWMPSLMGLGSLGLMFSQRRVRLIATVVCIVGVIGSILMLRSPVSAFGLRTLNGGAGTGIVQVGAWLTFLIVMNSFGAVAVFLVAILSAVKTAKHQAPVRFFTKMSP